MSLIERIGRLDRRTANLALAGIAGLGALATHLVWMAQTGCCCC